MLIVFVSDAVVTAVILNTTFIRALTSLARANTAVLTIMSRARDNMLVVLAGACMRKLDVVKGDCRDEKKLNRFFPFEPKDHLIPREKKNGEIIVYRT